MPGAGKGLFATEDIKAGEHIGFYTGKVLNDYQANRKPYVDSLYLVYVCKDYWINGEGRLANYTRYINHACKKCNSRLVTSTRWKTARIEAVRPIKAGEEIFFDYGDEYWETLGIKPKEPLIKRRARAKKRA